MDAPQSSAHKEEEQMQFIFNYDSYSSEEDGERLV